MIDRRNFLKTAGAVGVAGLAGCLGQFGQQPYRDGQVRFLMSPSEPQDLMMRQYAPVREHLENAIESDVTVQLQYARNYSATLDALGSGTGDIAETGPFAAALGVMANKVEIALQRKGFGTWTYKSVIVTRKETNIQETKDLKGKTIAFADMTSASGSLYPLYMIKQAGLDIGQAPQSDAGADFEATWSGHQAAFESLMSGQADAAGVGRFITLTENEQGERVYKEGVREVDMVSGIPRAPIIISPKLSDDEQNTLVNALLNAPKKMYLGKDGKPDTDDDLWFNDVRKASLETYQPVIDVAKELGIQTDLLDQAAQG
ncbi:MAG: substrate-binding domain-containing protein [Halobacteria archaeon]|nr:substrate-binding domain-containing protein [Halobacteria archaeon]